MAINATVDGNTYPGVETVTVGGKSIALTSTVSSVDSVNGQTGTVVLDAGDVGAEPATSVATQSAPTAITLADNAVYYLSDVATLTLTYPSVTHWECLIVLTTASSGTVTVTLPTSSYIGTAPTFGNGETWEVSIRDGVVVAGKAEAAS